MARQRLRKTCSRCGTVYRPGHHSWCSGCVAKRDKARPWYQTPRYRKAQKQAKLLTGQPCSRCGKPMQGRHKPSVEHVVPVAKGGEDGPLAVICMLCNSTRGSRDLEF